MEKTMLWATITVAFAITIGGLLAFMPPEEAEAKGPPIFKAKLTGSPAVGIPILVNNVVESPFCWTVASSTVVLDASGQLKVTAKGFLPCSGPPVSMPVDIWVTCAPGDPTFGFPPTGTPGSVVTHGSAILGTITTSGDLKAVGTTAPLGPVCPGLAVIVTPTSSPPHFNVWIGATGF